MHDYTFEQLINVGQVRQLLESHHQLSGMAYGLFDNNENDIVSVGWQEICTRFHRVHPLCSERCRESNASIKAHLGDVGDDYFEYRCGNGMIDIAMPIIIEGRHLATFFIGQFFYEDERPDKAFFVAQAGEFGFDLDDYLAALERVPILGREHVRSNLMFLHSMVLLLAESGLKSLGLGREMELRTEMANELRELNGELEHRVEERTAELTRVNRMLSILISCRRAIMRAEDEQILLHDICRILCDEAGYRFCWVEYAERDGNGSVRPVAWAGVDDGYLDLLNVAWADTERGGGPGCDVLRPGEVKDIASNPDSVSWSASAMARGCRSGIALPLRAAAATPFGALNIYSSEVCAFTRDEIRLLDELAEDLAFGISVLRMRSERKRMETMLKKSEERYRTNCGLLRSIFESSPDVIVFALDTDCNYLAFNSRHKETMRAIWGMAIAVGMNMLEVIGEAADRERARSNFVRAFSGESFILEEWYGDERLSRECWLNYYSPIRSDAGEVTGMTCFVQNITGRKRMEGELVAREQLFRSLVENSPDVIIRYDTEFRRVHVNPAFVRLVGKPAEALLGSSFTDRSSSIETINYQNALKQALECGREVTHEYAWPAGGGRTIVSHLRIVPEFGADGKVASVLAIGRDITELKRLEEQLNQSQKMEAVGQLAGGIAHDFNNIMTAIVGFAQIIGLKLGPGSPLNSYLDKILDSTERATGLTRDLLTFSRKQVMQLKPIEIGAAAAGSRQLISRLLREDIELTMSLPDVPLTVMAGETQLTQILMNLTANARDAMPSGGEIAITISSFTMSREYVARHGYGREGEFALISFADTGYGMDEKVRERIFEPFFTTKEVGQGTGLGLSTVYGVVRQLGGFINVFSEPGLGTIFRIYLPLIVGAATGDETIPPDVSPPGGTETILLAEDDPHVREIEESLLNEAGYRVLSARNGNEALRLFSDHKEEIDLLVLDAIMPGNNGIGVFQQARKIQPRIRAILVSGYKTEIMVVDGLIEQGLKFLQKPVRPLEFLQSVREMLDRQAIGRQPRD